MSGLIVFVRWLLNRNLVNIYKGGVIVKLKGYGFESLRNCSVNPTIAV